MGEQMRGQQDKHPNGDGQDEDEERHARGARQVADEDKGKRNRGSHETAPSVKHTPCLAAERGRTEARLGMTPGVGKRRASHTGRGGDGDGMSHKAATTAWGARRAPEAWKQKLGIFGQSCAAD